MAQRGACEVNNHKNQVAGFAATIIDLAEVQKKREETGM